MSWLLVFAKKPKDPTEFLNWTNRAGFEEGRREVWNDRTDGAGDEDSVEAARGDGERSLEEHGPASHHPHPFARRHCCTSYLDVQHNF